MRKETRVFLLRKETLEKRNTGVSDQSVPDQEKKSRVSNPSPWWNQFTDATQCSASRHED
jgi:hypothetical protein